MPLVCDLTMAGKYEVRPGQIQSRAKRPPRSVRKPDLLETTGLTARAYRRVTRNTTSHRQESPLNVLLTHPQGPRVLSAIDFSDTTGSGKTTKNLAISEFCKSPMSFCAPTISGRLLNYYYRAA
jgi:hypothetical protein